MELQEFKNKIQHVENNLIKNKDIEIGLCYAMNINFTPYFYGIAKGSVSYYLSPPSNKSYGHFLKENTNKDSLNLRLTALYLLREFFISEGIYKEL